jgi:hypothetical protein
MPVVRIAARIPNRPSTNKAALSMRMNCVLGSMRHQTNAHSAAMRHIRKSNDKTPPSMAKL